MSFQYAKDVLSQNDKDRLVCCFLNLVGTPNVNWDAAATDFGAASTNSFRTVHYNVMKKVNGGTTKRKADGEEPSTEAAATTPKKTPRKKTKKDAKQDVSKDDNKDSKVKDEEAADDTLDVPGI